MAGRCGEPLNGRVDGRIDGSVATGGPLEGAEGSGEGDSKAAGAHAIHVLEAELPWLLIRIAERAGRPWRVAGSGILFVEHASMVLLCQSVEVVEGNREVTWLEADDDQEVNERERWQRRQVGWPRRVCQGESVCRRE